METKERINKWDYIRQMFLHRKGRHQQNKRKTHRMGEHICLYIRCRDNIQNLQSTKKTQYQKKINNPIRKWA